jgi:hypothetical protein
MFLSPLHEVNTFFFLTLQAAKYISSPTQGAVQ